MIDSAIISWLKSAQPSATTSTTHSHFLMDYHTRKQKSIHHFWIDHPTVETERLAIHHRQPKTEGYPVTNWLSEFPFRYIFTRIKGYIIFLPISERMWFNLLQLSVFWSYPHKSGWTFTNIWKMLDMLDISVKMGIFPKKINIFELPPPSITWKIPWLLHPKSAKWREAAKQLKRFTALEYRELSSCSSASSRRRKSFPF